ncbi:hypothetical protein HXX76_013776 [Chlamydomonas incerta]|uniref:Uncharacterized protein n=1 Tax=Chlamydomonas incerta TaxID=51695 RepID=A0A835SDN3_CHLIN|nr:hypothetical protein HXX76_013776 [Chlamydomonas incerta]|eukprot:KAG2425362.1 hypothetical protein HXX76_013776 [Chlamydomonas incerta]
MVWRNLTRVGCGAAVAPDVQYGYCWVVACQYRASMNIYGYYGPNVLPPVNTTGPANCTAPSTGWCNTTAGAVQSSVVDCDGDGGLDVACREPGTTRRGVVLSSRSCRNDTGSYMNPDLGTMAWPNASPVFCPAVFGYNFDIVTAWAYGGGAYEVWRGNAAVQAKGVSWDGDNLASAGNGEAITWVAGSAPDPTQYHVCVRWYAAVRYFLFNSLTAVPAPSKPASFTASAQPSASQPSASEPSASCPACAAFACAYAAQPASKPGASQSLTAVPASSQPASFTASAQPSAAQPRTACSACPAYASTCAAQPASEPGAAQSLTAVPAPSQPASFPASAQPSAAQPRAAQPRAACSACAAIACPWPSQPASKPGASQSLAAVPAAS